MSRLACALLLAATSTACVIHFGDDDDVCAAAEDGGGTTAEADVALTQLVDPETLACVDFPFIGCGPCGDCAEPAIPSWGACQSQCTGLGERECIGTGGCRTAYDHACLTGDGECPALTPYLGCFAIDSTGPARGACGNLEAFECSRHDDCASTYFDSGACGNGLDDDGDGQVDEGDECRKFVACLDEQPPF